MPAVLTLPPNDIHDLVVEWADGTGDPLDLATRIVGFPLAVAVPAGATPLSVSAELALTIQTRRRTSGDGHTRRWRVGTEQWEQPVIVLGRDEGTLVVTSDDDGPLAGLEVDMGPNRERLGPAPD